MGRSLQNNCRRILKVHVSYEISLIISGKCWFPLIIKRSFAHGCPNNQLIYILMNPSESSAWKKKLLWQQVLHHTDNWTKTKQVLQLLGTNWQNNWSIRSRFSKWFFLSFFIFPSLIPFSISSFLLHFTIFSSFYVMTF